MRTQRDVCLYLKAYNQLSRHKEESWSKNGQTRSPPVTDGHIQMLVSAADGTRWSTADASGWLSPATSSPNPSICPKNITQHIKSFALYLTSTTQPLSTIPWYHLPPKLAKSSSWRPHNNWPDIRVHGFFLDMASKQISDCCLCLILAHHLIALTASSECGVFESARAHSRAHWWLRNAQRREGLVLAEPMCAEVKRCTAPACQICTSFAVPKATKSTRPPVWHLITWTKRLKGWKVLLATVLTSSLCESPVRRSSPGQLRVNVWTPAEDSGGSAVHLFSERIQRDQQLPPSSSHTLTQHFSRLLPAPPVPRLRSPPLTHSLTHQRAYTQSRKDLVPPTPRCQLWLFTILKWKHPTHRHFI